MAPINILYLSYDGMTDPLGQSQVIPYLAGLSKHGFHFHLVSFEKKDNFRKEHEHISKLLREHNIEWHPLSYTKKPPIISTMRDLGRMKKRGLELIKKHHIKILHCRSYISGIAGMALKEQTGARFLFDMRGFWADERVDGGLWNLNNPLFKAVYRYFKKEEKEMISKADAVISLTDNAKQEIESWNLRTSAQEPIRVIPCCADLEHFHPEAVTDDLKHKLKEKLHLHSGPVISYLGAIGTWYMLDEMLDFFKLFLKKHPGAIFLFISHEHAKNIIDKAAQKGIPEAALRFYASRRSDVPLALSLSDVSLFFIKPAYSKKASSPTKQGEIMGMGIPLICNKGVGDTDLVVQKYGSGIIVDLANPDELQTAVDDYDDLKKIPVANILQGAVDFYSLESGVEKYLAVYRKILQ